MARRLLLFLVALAVLAGGAPQIADAANGNLPRSELAQVAHPERTAYLADNTAAPAWNDMRLCSNRAGVELTPGPSSYTPAATAYRSRRVQDILYATLPRGIAARPGTSNHGWGRAVDLRLPRMRAWIDSHGGRYGWRKVEAFHEWWHVNYIAGAYRKPDPGPVLRFPTLRRGSGGRCQAPAVKEVQRRLGLDQSGSYGDGTRRAVKRFQLRELSRKSGTGVVGKTTWLKLREQRAIRRPSTPRLTSPTRMRGEDIRAVQGKLNARRKEQGKKPIHADGIFGTSTSRAIKNFQRSRRLDDTGVVGAKTLKALGTPGAKQRAQATERKAAGARAGYATKPGKAANRDYGCANVGSKLKRQECKIRALKAELRRRENYTKTRRGEQRRKWEKRTAQTRKELDRARRTFRDMRFNRSSVRGGPDVSAYQRGIDFRAVKRAGYELAILKATEGRTYTDPTWGCRLVHQARDAGLFVGAYHFAHPGRNGAQAEAKHFLSKLRSGCATTSRRLIPTLDLEVNHGLSGSELVKWATKFCDEVQRQLHRGCLLYTSPGFYGSLPRPGHVEALWLACYCSRPIRPSAFSSYALWQYTSTGPIPGDGRGDLNRFNGRGADLRRLTLGGL